ncbi:hypothetical protein [Paracoccus sp. T5]|uniref:hypothetical protein n=1 Tax=Paracoccus sp. T5 TaxID=3402161 RepID=UPI003AD8B668
MNARILQFELARLAGGLVALLPNLLAALIVRALTWPLPRYAGRGLTPPALAPAPALIAAVVLIFPGTLSRILSVGSLVAGLAFKGIFANYLAGLLILLRLSFREPVPLDGAQVSQRQTSKRC